MHLRIALAGGLALLAIAIGATLAHSPRSLAGTNSVANETSWPITGANAGACQEGEVLPRGTSAIRLLLGSWVGPKVTVRATAGNQLVTQGTLAPGWTGNATVPVSTVAQRTSNTKLCFTLGPRNQSVDMFGVDMFGKSTTTEMATTSEGQPLPGKMKIEYLRAGQQSWLSLASSVAQHMGFGHAAGGTWIVFFLMALMATAATITSWLLIRELR